ncbi:MAG: flippase [Candidatus Helarchaeota archaeon]
MNILFFQLTKTQKKLLENFTSLSILQATNYILPFITVPYLVRVLGPEKFGLIAFAQAFIQYFVLLTDYGFNLSATRRISIYREERQKLSTIFSSVYIIKTILLMISILLIITIVFLVPKFTADWQIYLITFGMVIGCVLFPVWFFQGIEKMKYITFLNILAKSIFTIAVFIFVRKERDYLIVPLLNSLGFITSGLVSIIIIWKNFRVKLIFPRIMYIVEEFKEGFHIFISTLAISLYTISNTFILGLFTNNIIVGYYSAGEKIIRAVQYLLTPLSQTIYPHISKLATESKEKALSFIRKILKYVGSISLVISVFILAFSPKISNILLGNQYEKSIPVIQILAFLPFLIGISNIFGIQIMLNFGLKKVFTNILVIASLINISIAIILVQFFQHIGIALSRLTTECFVTIIMYIFLQINGYNLIKFKAMPEIIKQ